MSAQVPAVSVLAVLLGAMDEGARSDWGSKEHLGDALEWIERHHPGGVALVARAMAETGAPERP